MITTEKRLECPATTYRFMLVYAYCVSLVAILLLEKLYFLAEIQ